MSGLHIFFDGDDFVVATDLTDAKGIMIGLDADYSGELRQLPELVAAALDAEATRIEAEAAADGMMSFAPLGDPTRSAAEMVRRAILVHEGKELP